MKHKMNENVVFSPVSIRKGDDNDIKKKVIPLSDSQVNSQQTVVNEKKSNIEQEQSKLNDSSFVAQKIDIEKELKDFELPIRKDPIPISNCRATVNPNEYLSIECVSNNLRESISEFRSFLRSEISSLSERFSQQSSKSSSTPTATPSPSNSTPENLQSLSNTILSVVKDNQRMLREMMNRSSIETSPEVLKQQLEEEEKKTQSLSIMLQSCIDDNDTLSKTVQSLQEAIQLHSNAEIEYTLLYKTALEEVNQAEANFHDSQKMCEELKKELDECKLLLSRRKGRREEIEERSRVTEYTARKMEDPKVEELLQKVNTYQFTNQLLVQQLAEERKRNAQKKDSSEIETLNKRIKSLEKERDDLQKKYDGVMKENEEMKQLLSKMDVSDFQFIDDSSDDS